MMTEIHEEPEDMIDNQTNGSKSVQNEKPDDIEEKQGNDIQEDKQEEPIAVEVRQQPNDAIDGNSGLQNKERKISFISEVEEEDSAEINDEREDVKVPTSGNLG